MFGAQVSLQDSASLKGRVGVSIDYEQESEDAGGQKAKTHLYGTTSLYYDFAGASHTDVSGTDFANQNDPLTAGIGIGGSYNWNNDKYSVYGEASAVTGLRSLGQSFSLRATGGMRGKW